MSMPTYTLECDRCDYKAGSAMTWGRFEYELPEGRVPVNRTIGWCNQCEGFQAIEVLELDSYERESLWLEIEQVEKTVFSYFWRYLAARMTGSYRRSVKSMVSIREYVHQLMLIDRRKGTERCLTCGSTDHQSFNETVRLQYSGTYSGEQLSDFEHPGCGGKIKMVGADMRLSMVFNTIRVYSPDGEYLCTEPRNG